MDGLEGWTSCCEAAVTYSEDVLCCKGCWAEVTEIHLGFEAGRALTETVRAVIHGSMTPDEGVARQREILAGAVSS
jgi:hypothetical protein